MTYNFDQIINRRNTHSLKWNVKETELPMWVADMDFETAPPIKDAILKRAAHGIYGYADLPEEWYQAYIHWWEKRHGFSIQKEWLVFCTGVVPAISSVVRKLTTPAEKVLIQTPVYNIFFHSILNHGRQVLESPLLWDGSEYQIDFTDLEQKLADPQTSLMILCNPHNPVGKIWDKETLAHIGALCHKHHVTVISDEIHCDLTAPGHQYVPFAAASEECRNISITCIAPTKTFNLAGLQTAAVVIADETLRHKVWRGLNTDEIAEPNVFAVEAPIAAFEHGAEWLDALRVYIQENKDTAARYIQTHLPQAILVPSEATYLLWLDIGKQVHSAAEAARFIRENTGLYVSSGAQYGKAGESFLRINAACPRKILLDGLERLRKGLDAYQELSIEFTLIQSSPRQTTTCTGRASH